MGLDVSLYRYEGKTPEEWSAIEHKSYEDESKIWDSLGDFDKMTESQKKKYWADEKARHLARGLDSDGVAGERIEIPSKTRPDHLFKIGYWRSSYNDSGINHIARNLIDTDLYQVCGMRDGQEDNVSMDWPLVRVSALAAAKKLQAAEPLRCYHVARHPADKGAQSGSEALDIVKKALADHRKVNDRFSSYSNINGNFALKEPMEVVALIPGFRATYRGTNEACVYVVEKQDMTSYVESFLIMAETAEYVLANDPSKFRMSWNG